MDNIYIDTSIFEGNNFLESKRINEIFRLAEEKHIQIIIPAITFNEIIDRGIKNVKEALGKYVKFRTDTRTLRNLPSLQNRFEFIDVKSCIEEFTKTFNERIQKSNCIITDYPTVNIKDVFDKYFKDEFPFSHGGKKHEFPDAFALLSVETWCKESGQKCYVFSSDNDLLNYKSEWLIIVDSYEKFLDNKLRETQAAQQQKQRLEIASKAFQRQKHRLEQDVMAWITSQLESGSTYYKYTHFDIHDISVQNVTASLADYEIVSIDKNGIIVESKAEIEYEVEIEIDDKSSGYYDKEDKDWTFFDTEVESISKRQIISVHLKGIYPIAGDEYMDFEIDEINNGRDINV